MKTKKAVVIFLALLIAAVPAGAQAAQSGKAAKEPEALTVEQAVKKAVAASTSVKNHEENVTLSDENISDLRSQLRDAMTWAASLGLMSRIIQAEAQTAVDDKSNEAVKGNLKLSVTRLFASIIGAEKTLELYDQNMELQARQMEIAKVKLGLGMISQMDYDNQESAFMQRENERDAQETAIDEAYMSLNKALGAAFDKRYALELTFEYEPMEERDIRNDVRNAIDSNTSIMNQRIRIDAAEYKLDKYDQMQLTESKESIQITIEQALRAINDTKAGLEQSVIQTHNAIRKQESQYGTAVLKLEGLYGQLRIKEKQLELGKATQIEVDSLKYSIAEQEESIRSLVVNHALNILQYKTPGALTAS